jgi:hypothetical protein
MSYRSPARACRFTILAVAEPPVSRVAQSPFAAPRVLMGMGVAVLPLASKPSGNIAAP